MKNYFKQTSPFIVPTNDGKLIEEHFGLPSSGEKNYSIAHMNAPPNWSEPFQNPEFEEIIIMINGKIKIIVDDEELILQKGETFKLNKGVRVQSSNPFNESAEYWCVCIPAFSLESAHRE
ncbi:MAG: cupin domain-containing protein [Ignavibacteria bacterium]|nr:cupin domain-containing protein [Bacteroidota bacterium]MSQ46004.1 cupin domain-containing protein [Ignavibacteria bacterium]